jgi:hypothetical protein
LARVWISRASKYQGALKFQWAAPQSTAGSQNQHHSAITFTASLPNQLALSMPACWCYFKAGHVWRTGLAALLGLVLSQKFLIRHILKFLLLNPASITDVACYTQQNKCRAHNGKAPSRRDKQVRGAFVFSLSSLVFTGCIQACGEGSPARAVAVALSSC